MLKNLLGGAAVLALSGHTVFASNVIVNGVPHHGSGPINISHGAGATACCDVQDLPYNPLPVIHQPATVTTTHAPAPVVTYQSAPIVTHQAAPSVVHHAAPPVTTHEVIVNQLPAPAPIAAPIVAAPVVAAPVVKAPAQRGWSSRVYVGARGGLSFAEDTDFTFNRVGTESDFDDPGYTISGVVGWAAKVNRSIGYRLEAELGYSQADVDSISTEFATASGSGETETIFGFANAYVDIPVFDRLSATVGGGLGAGYVNVENGVSGGPDLVDDSDTAFGYHLDAGLSYDVTEQLAVEALYRYTSFVNVDVTASDGTSSDTNVDSHNVLIGARYGF